MTTQTTAPPSGRDLLATSERPKYVAMPASAILLMLAAVCAGLFGLAMSSQASAGASIVGFACLLGILARMAQAAGYERGKR